METIFCGSTATSLDEMTWPKYSSLCVGPKCTLTFLGTTNWPLGFVVLGGDG